MHHSGIILLVTATVESALIPGKGRYPKSKSWAPRPMPSEVRNNIQKCLEKILDGRDTGHGFLMDMTEGAAGMGPVCQFQCKFNLR